MQFALTEDQEMLRDAARDFADAELAPRAPESDRTETFVAEQIQLCAEMGFCGMSVPEAYGGSALGSVGSSLVLFEVNRACPSSGVTLSVHNSLACGSLIHHGTEEQKRRYLPKLASGEWIGAYALSEANAGSDAAALRCKAEPDGNGGWALNGSKLWLSHGDVSGYAVLFARTDPDAGPDGITAFAVETAWDGYNPGKHEKKMGLRGSNTVEIHLDNLKVPAENVIGEVNGGYKIALSLLSAGRIGIAAQGVGISMACLEASVKYARERHQFGKPIAAFGAIQEKIAEMATRTESARLLTLQASWLYDNGKPHVREAAMAKLASARCANYCAKEAVQIHGGAGYTQEFPVERYFRDARITEIYEGTTEVQRIVIARSLLRD